MKKKEEKETKKNVSSKTDPAPVVITDAEVQTCLDHLSAIDTVLAPYAVTMTTAERKSATRIRKGGDKVIPLMARLATSAGVTGTAFDVSAIQTQVDLAKALLPLLTNAKTLSDKVSDTVLAANGQAWSSATTLHGVLKRVTKDEPSMRRDMEVVSAAFAIRKRSAAKSATETPAPASEAAATTPTTEAPTQVVAEAPASGAAKSA